MSQRAFDREAQRRERADARRTTLRRRRAGLAAGAVGAAVLFAPSAASAAPFEVTTLADDGTPGTLRSAITQANANADADTITFAPGILQVADPTIYLALGQLSVTGGPVTITGPGADELSISGKTAADQPSGSRIFLVSGSGDLRISGLTLTDGDGTAADGDGANGAGGAILVNSKLTVTDSVVTANKATNNAYNRTATGGGIDVTFGAQATVEGSEITSNETEANQGVATGGGIANQGGTLTLRDSTVTGNSANGNTTFGGGVTAAGTTTIERSHVDDNGSQGYVSSGGGIAASNDLKYPEPDQSSRRSVVRATAGAPLLITDSTVSENDADYGGGISADFSQDKTASDVTIVRSTVDSNIAQRAGGGIGVRNQVDGNDFTVRESTVSNNSVQYEEIEPPARSQSRLITKVGHGGGLDFSDVRGDALVSNSTVSGNSARNGGGIHAGAFEDDKRESSAVEPDSPDARSAAPDDTRGNTGTTTGPAPNPPTPTGSLSVANTTVADNEANFGGGVSTEPGATDGEDAGLNSTIVGDNVASDGTSDVRTAGGEGLDAGYSLIETPGAITPVAGQPNISGQDPALGALTDNGGPTLTHLPAGSSPAIDAGTGNGLSTDQRGFARTQNRPPANVTDGTDIGAVEIPGLDTPAVTPGRPVTPSATPTICGRRAISLVRADIRGSKVKLTGLVGSRFYGKTVTIQTDPQGAKSSKFTKTTTAKASRTGSFSVRVPKPDSDERASVRYRAVIGSAKSPALKLPQSLTSRSVKSAKGTITVKGKVKLSVLGKANKVKIRRLVCGRYRTVGSAKPDARGNYTITFKGTAIRGVAFYRAESKVLRKPGSKVYVIQYARAIAIKTTSQTG